MAEIKLEVYDPSGGVEVTQSFAPRLADLNGKTICELSHAGFQSERTFARIRELLRKRFPTLKIVPYTEFGVGRAEMESEQTLDSVVKRGADAVITGNAAWGSCSTGSGRAAAKAEMRGIPSMVITRESFTGIVNGAFSGLGFPAEAPTVLEFPNRMFVPGSDLSPIEQNIDKIIYGLTKWEPKVKKKGITTPPKVTVSGKDYEEAVTNMNYLFLRNMWSDGLPLVPPTEERVNWILRGTDLSPDTVVGKILPRGRLGTVKALAIILAMAGGRPEYLPVLIAAVEAFTEPLFRHDWMNTTTGAVFPGVIVNGPIAKQIRLNSGYGCLGPRPAYPAGGPIGRAIRLLLMAVGGGIAGIGSMSIHGNNRYTNFVIAEDEDGLPRGWEPFSVDRGFSKGSDVVTVMPACDYQFIGPSTITGTKDTRVTNMGTNTRGDLQGVLDAYAERMSISSMGSLPKTGLGSGQVKDQVLGVVLIARRTAAGAAGIGLSKADFMKALWENSKKSWATIEKTFPPDRIKQTVEEGGGVWVEGKPWPLTRTPEQILIVVAGGEQSDHAYWINLGGASGYQTVSKKMKLPAKTEWDKLIKESETDLGPFPMD